MFKALLPGKAVVLVHYTVNQKQNEAYEFKLSIIIKI